MANDVYINASSQNKVRRIVRQNTSISSFSCREIDSILLSSRRMSHLNRIQLNLKEFYRLVYLLSTYKVKGRNCRMPKSAGNIHIVACMIILFQLRLYKCIPVPGDM